MSADNYALVGIHPLAGTDGVPKTLHGVYVGFKSNELQPSKLPARARAFNTHAEAAAYAEELETEYGVRFLCDCDCTTKEEAPMADWEKELLYPTPKKTVRQVIREYADTLDHIYSARTAGDFTWTGILHEFMDEIAMAVDE